MCSGSIERNSDASHTRTRPTSNPWSSSAARRTGAAAPREARGRARSAQPEVVAVDQLVQPGDDEVVAAEHGVRELGDVVVAVAVDVLLACRRRAGRSAGRSATTGCRGCSRSTGRRGRRRARGRRRGAGRPRVGGAGSARGSRARRRRRRPPRASRSTAAPPGSSSSRVDPRAELVHVELLARPRPPLATDVAARPQVDEVEQVGRAAGRTAPR